MNQKNNINVLFDAHHNNKGVISGYGSVFDITDDQQDIICPGAFYHSLANWEALGKLPKMLWQHDAREPIGIWHLIEEDTKGLYVEGQLILETQRGKEAYALIKSGALDGLSIGFHVQEAEKKEHQAIRYLTRIHLIEISIVTFAANRAAQITQVKKE